MVNIKKYKPKIDKLFYIMLVVINVLSLTILIIPQLFYLSFESFIFSIIVILFINYFLISPLFGYIEIKETSIFIKYGIILKKEIPFNKIKKLELKKKWYSDSILALKCSIEHVEITFNSYDKTCVSVKENDIFIEDVRRMIT